jgi:3-isopropylmalate/(R)-2-methylmalate dehydratase small subunit
MRTSVADRRVNMRRRRWRAGAIGAVIGESFAEIFFSNAMAIGLVCVTAAKDDVARLMTTVEQAPATDVSVDLQSHRVTAGSVGLDVTLPAPARESLLSGGWDATGLLLENYDEVERT